MDPDEIEFIAENSEIGIVPNFSFDPIHLISGSLHKFTAGIPIHVPLWLAIHLRKQQKCRIVPPEWFDRLDEIKELETQSPYFTKMPHEHYMIITKLVLTAAADDITNSEEIRTMVKDIWDIRTSKLRTSMDAFIKGDNTYAKLDNLTMLEIHSVRPLLPYSLDLISRLHKVAKPHQTGHSSSTDISSSNNSNLNISSIRTGSNPSNTTTNFTFHSNK